MANKTSEKKTEVQTTAKGKAAQKVKNSSANLTRKVQKEPVKIREQVLSNGTRSLYLDIIYHGKRKREFLKAYLVDAKIPAERRQNAQAMAFAEAVKGKRLIELQTKEYSFTKQYEEDTPFLTYFRKLCEERFKKKDSKGNWGNWHSCLKHLENYCDEKTTFKDIDREWILGFKEYLENVEKDTGKKTRNKNNNLFVGLSQNSKVSYFGNQWSSVSRWRGYLGKE